MFKKRGQIAIFAIIAVVLILVASIAFYLRNSSKKTDTSSEQISDSAFDITPIQIYTETCLKKASEEGLWLVGVHGGYVNPDGDTEYGESGTTLSTTYQGEKVPYYLDWPTKSTLSLPEIERKLSKYIIVEFEKCLNLDVFRERGFEITQPDIDYKAVNFDFDSIPVDVDVKANLADVTVKLEYPLNIKKGNSETKLEKFIVNIPVRLRRVHDAAVDASNSVINKIILNWSNDEEFNLTSEVNCDWYDPKLYLTIYANNNADPNTKIIKIVDYDTYYHKYLKSYIFQFAVKKNPLKFTDDNRCSGTFI